MDYLWTPWRYAYVSATEKTVGCVFCEAVKQQNDEKTYIVYRGQCCFVILNAFPYTPGHVMVVPYQHLDELRKLPTEAANEMILSRSAWRRCSANSIVRTESIWG